MDVRRDDIVDDDDDETASSFARWTKSAREEADVDEDEFSPSRCTC